MRLNEEDGEDVVETRKLDEFMEWLEEMTEFGEWDVNVRIEVRQKLIDILLEAKAQGRRT